MATALRVKFSASDPAQWLHPKVQAFQKVDEFGIRITYL